MEVLLRVRERVPFEIEKVDITGDPLLASRYRFSIPVIHVDGQFAFRHRVDEEGQVSLLTLP